MIYKYELQGLSFSFASKSKTTKIESIDILCEAVSAALDEIVPQRGREEEPD